jgi:NDP-sugar pyrophosphorylase family protein
VSFASNLTAIILCGGKGERLKPLTETLPKTLVPLNGRPLLTHLLQYLTRSGVKRVVICVGYKAELIKKFLDENPHPSLELFYVDSGDATMTDRLRDARKHISGPALVCYGDTLANIDLAALSEAHQASDALVTVTIYPLHSQFGVVTVDESKRVVDFTEKPRLPYWINIGFMLFKPAAFDYLKPGSNMTEFLATLVEARALSAYEHEGKHLTVNTEKERAAAEIEMIEFFTLLDENKI